MPRSLGRHQIAICQRSGVKCRAADLVSDGRIPGLLVLPEWADPPHPQEEMSPLDDRDGAPRWPVSPDQISSVPPVLSILFDADRLTADGFTRITEDGETRVIA